MTALAGLVGALFLACVVPASAPAGTSTTTMPLAPRCAQPVSAGVRPSATDCLFILGAAVGIRQCDPDCVCDVNGDSSRSATDALICLKIAIGVDLPLACPCAGTTTTTTIGSGSGACCRGTFCFITAPLRCRGTFLGPSNNTSCSVDEILACGGGSVTTTTLTTATTLPVGPGVCCSGPACSITERFRCRGTFLGPSDNTSCSAQEIAACGGPATTTTTTTTTTLPPATGACCARGICAITRPDRCRGIYLGDSDSTAVCSAEEEAACSGPVTTVVTATTTTTTTVPPTRGVCCIRGRCEIIEPEFCQGVYLGDSINLFCSSEEAEACTSAVSSAP